MKHLIILIMSIMTGFGSVAQQEIQKTALLLIDIQEFYFPGGKWALSGPEKAAQNAALLLQQFRQEGDLVVHVRHDTEPGGAIHSLVAPLPGEKVFTKKEVNAFRGTGLLEYLQEQGVTGLVLCGMQTHMCLEAATRAASDLGFECTVVGDACATRDLEHENETVKAREVHLSTLSTLKSYGTVTETRLYLNVK